jgi:hypothetical protein
VRTWNLMHLAARMVLWLGAMAALSLLGLGSGAARAQAPTPIPNYPPGTYIVTLDCGTGHTVSATTSFTLGGNVVGSVTQACPPRKDTTKRLYSEWNDLSVRYRCDGGSETILEVPIGTLVLNKPYYLLCPSPGGMHHPTAGDPPGDPYVLITAGGVGGIAELPPLVGASAEEAGTPADGSGWSAGGYAALAGGLAAAAVGLSAGAWYARRRWLR